MRGSRLALACTSACLFASVAAAQDPYTDFRVPEARSFTWLVAGNARWNGSYDAFPGTSLDTRRSNGGLLTDLHRHAESEAFVSDRFLTVRGLWQQSRTTERFSSAGSEVTDDFTGDSQEYDASAGASTTRYLGGSGWGLDAAFSADYVYARSASAQGSRTVSGNTDFRNRIDFESHDYRGFLEASLGPGYGRVRDVTGVFDMQVLEERLEATGRLHHPLSPAARQQLAELFSVSGDFQAAHDRPDRYLWREVERILREDDAIEAGTFDAWSLMRALEPATLSIAITRLAGWRVSGAYDLTLERGHSDTETRGSTYSSGPPPISTSGESGMRSSNDENRGFALVNVDWHRPLGMRWQTDLAGTARYGDGPRREIYFLGMLGLTNVLADRWVATVTVSDQSASLISDSVRTSPEWNVHGSAQLSYFFEDSWSITAGVDHSQVRPFYEDGINPTVPKGYMRQTQIVIGLTYRPVGRFEAPGLRVAERLAPGGL